MPEPKKTCGHPENPADYAHESGEQRTDCYYCYEDELNKLTKPVNLNKTTASSAVAKYEVAFDKAGKAYSKPR